VVQQDAKQYCATEDFTVNLGWNAFFLSVSYLSSPSQAKRGAEQSTLSSSIAVHFR